jgi:hypothetical protein
MLTADRSKRKRDEMRKAEAASCRNRMKFFSRDALWYTNVRLSIHPFHMSRSNLRTPWPIHFKFHRVIGIDGLTVCILYGEIVDNITGVKKSAHGQKKKRKRGGGKKGRSGLLKNPKKFLEQIYKFFPPP